MAGVKEELSLLLRGLSTATTISLSVVFSVFAGVLTGYYLDNHVFKGSTTPWLTMLFLCFGIGGGIKNFIILSRRFKDDEDKKGKGEGKVGD